MLVSIIIPTFNEQSNVYEITKRIHTTLHLSDIDYDIWFIDDSHDDTPQLLSKLAQEDTKVHYHHREGTRGLGTAVVEGFNRSQGQYLIVMDGDLQHPPELLFSMIQALQSGADIVIPSRFIAGGSDGGLNLSRKLVSFVARSIGQIAIKRFRNITDCTSGYFGLNRDVIREAPLLPSSWKILMEILVKGHYQSVQEIPYQFVSRNAGESKMNWREQWNYLAHIVKLAKYK